MKARFPVSRARVSDNRRRPRASPPLTPAFATSSTPPLLVACRSLLAARCSLLAAAAAVACRCWREGGCPRQPLPATFFVRRPSFLHMWELKRFWIDGYMSELVGSPPIRALPRIPCTVKVTSSSTPAANSVARATMTFKQHRSPVSCTVCRHYHLKITPMVNEPSLVDLGIPIISGYGTGYTLTAESLPRKGLFSAWA